MLSVGTTRKEIEGILYRLRFTPVARGSIRVPATFMSALPQTRHKISPSAVVDGFLCECGTRTIFSPRCGERKRRTKVKKKKGKTGEKEKKAR